MSTPLNPGDETDGQLLRRYLDGDAGAFAALVKRYQIELYHFLVRFLGDRAAAEDVFQETFLQVHESAAKFDLDRPLRPWLFTIAANKARDLLRHSARRPLGHVKQAVDETAPSIVELLEAAASVPDQPLQDEELREQVRRTIAAMPAHLREILLLGYFHEFSYKQISDMLEIPIGTVKSRLHSAVGHFARSWKSQRPDVD